MRMQMHWRLSPLSWLFQLKRQKKYSTTVMTCIVRNSSLKMIKLQQETFKSKKL